MSATPVAEPTTIDHLDFTIACEITHIRDRRECQNPADWWILAAHHCLPDETCENYICQFHHDYLLSGGKVRCRRCRESFDASPRIVRTERIR